MHPIETIRATRTDYSETVHHAALKLAIDHAIEMLGAQERQGFRPYIVPFHAALQPFRAEEPRFLTRVWPDHTKDVGAAMPA